MPIFFALPIAFLAVVLGALHETARRRGVEPWPFLAVAIVGMAIVGWAAPLLCYAAVFVVSGLGRRQKERWQCPECRFYNDPSTLVCACGHRPDAPEVDVEERQRQAKPWRRRWEWEEVRSARVAAGLLLVRVAFQLGLAWIHVLPLVAVLALGTVDVTLAILLWRRVRGSRDWVLIRAVVAMGYLPLVAFRSQGGAVAWTVLAVEWSFGAVLLILLLGRPTPARWLASVALFPLALASHGLWALRLPPPTPAALSPQARLEKIDRYLGWIDTLDHGAPEERAALEEQLQSGFKEGRYSAADFEEYGALHNWVLVFRSPPGDWTKTARRQMREAGYSDGEIAHVERRVRETTQ